jgi:hypothetical protein
MSTCSPAGKGVPAAPEPAYVANSGAAGSQVTALRTPNWVAFSAMFIW